MIDIDAIEERHYESFLEKCEKDKELDDLVWENFGENPEDIPYEIAFNTLYKWDAEYFVDDPEGCILAYMEKD